MSLGIDDFRDPDVPVTKKPRDLTGGGGSPIPGGGGLPTFGFGGGNSPGAFGAASTGVADAGALRTLLRKRLALPSSTTPSYLSSAPADAAGSSMFGGNVTKLLAAKNPGAPQLQPAGPTTGPSEWTPEGANPSGDPTIDLNDWSGSGWDQSRTLNQLYDLLKRFSDFGSFSPEGNRGLMDFARTEALGNAEAIRQRSSLIGENFGVDPSTSASYALQSDLNSQGGVADAMNAASRGVLERQDEFGKALLQMLAQFNMNDWSAERSGDISKRYAPDQSGGGVGGFLGNLGGRALGGFLGGGGWR